MQHTFKTHNPKLTLILTEETYFFGFRLYFENTWNLGVNSIKIGIFLSIIKFCFPNFIFIGNFTSIVFTADT